MATFDDHRHEITAEVLLKAYAIGIFPMAESADDDQLYWIEPEHRGVLPLHQLHVPSRLRRTVRQDLFEIRIDTAFDQVMRGCAAARPGRANTWINATILRLYRQLHELGHCHSVEAWRNDQLVGGLYGVHLRGAFFGESMFSVERDASKVALVHLCARLVHGGFSLLDTQFVTEHLRQFGTREVRRDAFQVMLEGALKRDADFGRLPAGANGAEAMRVLRHEA